MKKIIIVSDSLRIGGIQKSLRNLLDMMDFKDLDVSLLLFNDNYPEDLNKNIKCLKSNWILRIISLTKKEAKEKGLIIYFIRLLLALFCRILGSNLVYNIIYLFTKNIGEFDTALSYSNNANNDSVYFGYNKFVLKKVKAKKKITYLHVDYEAMNLNNKVNNKEYEKFDKILTVSEYTKDVFLKCLPHLKDKVEVLYNTLPNIKDNLKNPYKFKKFIIVSAGRLDENKDPESQLLIAKKLREKNLNFKWYIIGDGQLKSKLYNKIDEYKLNNYVYLLGSKNEIYPYLKFANVYVSTSKSESYGLSIAEALLLNTIVVAKEYPALHEIIENNGFICKDNEEICLVLEQLINSKDFYEKSKKGAKLIVNNEQILKKLENILKGEVYENVNINA